MNIITFGSAYKRKDTTAKHKPLYLEPTSYTREDPNIFNGKVQYVIPNNSSKANLSKGTISLRELNDEYEFMSYGMLSADSTFPDGRYNWIVENCKEVSNPQLIKQLIYLSFISNIPFKCYMSFEDNKFLYIFSDTVTGQRYEETIEDAIKEFAKLAILSITAEKYTGEVAYLGLYKTVENVPVVVTELFFSNGEIDEVSYMNLDRYMFSYKPTYLESISVAEFKKKFERMDEKDKFNYLSSLSDAQPTVKSKLSSFYSIEFLVSKLLVILKDWGYMPFLIREKGLLFENEMSIFFNSTAEFEEYTVLFAKLVAYLIDNSLLDVETYKIKQDTFDIKKIDLPTWQED